MDKNKNDIKKTEVCCQRVDADSPGIVYVGRVKRDETGGVHFRLPGVQIHARFIGDSIAVEMAPYSGYFMVELDDFPPFKVISPRCEKVINLASGLPWGKHVVKLTYCNEGETAPPVFYGFILGPQGQLLDRPELPERKIEFIGDSITCGYGIEDNSEIKAYPYIHVNNAYYSYAQQTARMLAAQCVQVSRSGICLNYDRHTPGVAVFHNMFSLYPFTLFAPEHDSEKWNHKKYVPDVVCINLGTNDCEQPGFDKDDFAVGMVKFVKCLRSRYECAKVVLLSGPMLSGEQLANVKYALDRAVEVLKNEGENEVYRFDFAPDDGTLDYGTLGHPSLKRHTLMARELSLYMKLLMDW